MKAKEFMIGDWVLALDSTHKERVFVQIDAIEEGQTSILVKKDCSNWFVDIAWILPIPLTPEILEKNELKCANGFTGILYWVNERCYLKKQHSDYFEYNYHDGYDKVVIDLKYVHELQHVLRICGINKEFEL